MNDGRILAAHCDCMAGLGETCSHAVSLFWVIDFGVESRESLTATLIKMGCIIYTFKGVLTATNPKLPLGCNQTPMRG